MKKLSKSTLIVQQKNDNINTLLFKLINKLTSSTNSIIEEVVLKTEIGDFKLKKNIIFFNGKEALIKEKNKLFAIADYFEGRNEICMLLSNIYKVDVKTFKQDFIINNKAIWNGKKIEVTILQDC